MPWTTHLLVVASQTAQAPELVAYLKERARTGPLKVTLLVPAELGGRERARARIEGGLRALRDEGIEATGIVPVDGDPLHAILDVYDRHVHDEVVISTLPEHVSVWLGCGLPSRVAQTTGALVRHVECQAPPERPAPEPDAMTSQARIGGWSWMDAGRWSREPTVRPR